MEAKETSQSMETINKKTLYTKSKGHTVTVDYFIFNCLEEEKTMRSLGLDNIGKNCSRLDQILEDSSNTKEALTSLFSWYCEEYPHLSSEKVLDIQTHALLVQEFNSLKLDIELILNKKIGKVPPVNTSLPEEKELWDHLDELFKASFPNYSEFFIKYLHWSFKKAPSQARDLKSVPPVGQYMFLLKREFGSSSFWGKKPSSFQNQKGGGGVRSNSSFKHNNHQSRNDSRFKHNNNKFNKEKPDNKASEQEALQEVVDVIKRLKANPDLDGMVLKPQNSFLRRLQHKKIADLKFTSSSVGEGNNRAVKIENSQS